jgi:MFS family permease
MIVLAFGSFIVMSGMTMVVPFLAYYIQELGVTDPDQVGIWTGVVFAGNFVTAFIFQPIWGKWADRFGRKIMVIRSGLGMALTVFLMSMATSVWHLLLLRLLNGVVSGFNPAAVAIVSAGTPKKHMGFAMGIIQSGTVAGTILGPFIGGVLAGWIGYRPLFLLTGSLLLIATLLVMLVVKESFNREEAREKAVASVRHGLGILMNIPQLPAIYAVSFMIQFSLLSSMPLLPLFIQNFTGLEKAAFFAGVVGAATGTSNMLASPLLGRLSDRIGANRVLQACLIGAALVLIPQAWAPNVGVLIALRFLQGMFMGGLLPSVNALIRLHTPDGMESRAFSFNASVVSLGNLIGPVLGGVLAVWIGIRGIFLLGGLMFLVNAWWVHRSLVSRGAERWTSDRS